MPTDHSAKLATIRRFDQLVDYLRDEMGWPIGRDDFEELTRVAQSPTQVRYRLRTTLLANVLSKLRGQ